MAEYGTDKRDHIMYLVAIADGGPDIDTNSKTCISHARMCRLGLHGFPVHTDEPLCMQTQYVFLARMVFFIKHAE